MPRLIERGRLGEAWFSPCRRYRYLLTRGPARGPRVVFVMLNPSTADADRSDPTITRATGFAARLAAERGWPAPRLEIVNLFALRATDPRALRRARDPVGPDDDAILDARCARAALIVCAWGVHGALADRGDAVRARLRAAGRALHHLGLTRAGHPRHPLYLAASTPLSPW